MSRTRREERDARSPETGFVVVAIEAPPCR